MKEEVKKSTAAPEPLTPRSRIICTFLIVKSLVWETATQCSMKAASGLNLRGEAQQQGEGGRHSPHNV